MSNVPVVNTEIQDHVESNAVTVSVKQPDCIDGQS